MVWTGTGTDAQTDMFVLSQRLNLTMCLDATL